MERRILADTSGVIALLNRDDRSHRACVEIFEANIILVPATILPEVDYMVTKYLGERVARTFLEDLLDGRYNYLSVDEIDLRVSYQLMTRYRDLPLGLVDASVVALAQRYKIRRILTLDRRHFNLIRTESIEYLELLP